MAGTYHVFIERSRDVSPGAATRLAEAMAEHYGLPLAQMKERLAAGRVRVKTGVDRTTAETFAADLTRLGAVCSIVGASDGEPVAAPTPAPAPPPAKPLPPAKPPVPLRPKAPSTPFASGLSAAFSPTEASPRPQEQDLGALNLDSGEFSLATLDGKNDSDREPAAAASFAPPGDAAALPASIGPAIAAPAPAPVHVETVDPFAPPEAGEKLQLLDLDVDPAAERRRRGGTTNPVGPASPPVNTMSAGPGAASADGPEVVPRGPGIAGWIRDQRVRLGAGVGIAILLGFIPATVVASLRESSAYAQIDDEVQRKFRGVVTISDYQALDGFLATQLARKKDARGQIALASLLIWAGAGAGVGFLWFRKIDWDAVAARFES